MLGEAAFLCQRPQYISLPTPTTTKRSLSSYIYITRRREILVEELSVKEGGGSNLISIFIGPSFWGLWVTERFRPAGPTHRYIIGRRNMRYSTPPWTNIVVWRYE